MHSREHESSAGEGRAQTLAVTRRSVVRAGAAAAWTAPLVQVLAPAPAQAVGSVNALSLTGTFAHTSGSRNFTFSGTVTNTSASNSTVGLAITVAWTTAGPDTLAQNGGAALGSATSGWTPSSITYSNGDLTASVTYTRSTQLAASGSTAFTATLVSANGGNSKSQGGSGTATATATGFNSAATGNSYSG